jgi:molybdopterin-guanine dinucleotide biosynthesis protein
LNKLLRERNPQKYLESLSKVNLKTFNLNEIEILMKNYCEKVLGYKKKDIDKIVNVQKEGENVYQTIENIISKTKKKPLENYNNKKDIKRSLQEVNNSIFNLKRKFIFGKTNFIFE